MVTVHVMGQTSQLLFEPHSYRVGIGRVCQHRCQNRAAHGERLKGVP